MFRQRPWLPWWLAIVAPIAVALAVVLISLLPKQATVPNLKGAANVFAAQKLVNGAGFQLAPRTTTVVDATKQPGAIADQSPRAGTKAKRGSIVTVAVYTGTGRVAVPSVLGATPGLADQALRASQLTLGAVNPQPLDPTGRIRSQIPLPGTKVAAGTAVAVFMAPAGAAGAGGRQGCRRDGGREARRRGGCRGRWPPRRGRGRDARGAGRGRGAGRQGPDRDPAAERRPDRRRRQALATRARPGADEAAGDRPGRRARGNGAARRRQGPEGRAGRPADLERVAAARL